MIKNYAFICTAADSLNNVKQSYKIVFTSCIVDVLTTFTCEISVLNHFSHKFDVW